MNLSWTDFGFISVNLMYVLLIYVLLILSIGLQKIHFGIRIV